MAETGIFLRAECNLAADCTAKGQHLEWNILASSVYNKCEAFIVFRFNSEILRITILTFRLFFLYSCKRQMTTHTISSVRCRSFKNLSQRRTHLRMMTSQVMTISSVDDEEKCQVWKMKEIRACRAKLLHNPPRTCTSDLSRAIAVGFWQRHFVFK